MTLSVAKGFSPEVSGATLSPCRGPHSVCRGLLKEQLPGREPDMFDGKRSKTKPIGRMAKAFEIGRPRTLLVLAEPDSLRARTSIDGGLII